MGYDVTLTLGMSKVLYNLQQIEDTMQTTNNRLSTGKKVNSALDDPINYFSAQDHLYRSSDLEARKDEMNEAAQLIEAANSGVESILDMIDQAISLANAANTADSQTDVNSLEDQFNDILTQIDNVANDAFYKGTNLLGGVTEQLTVYFNADGSSSLTLTGADASSTGLGLTTLTADDWWDTTNGVPDETGIQASIDELTDAKSTLRTMAKTLSMDLSTIEVRLDFADLMMNTLDTGAANLTVADTNEESAALLMLQTQQQLSINSLSIASDAAQSVLGLFS